MMGFAKIAGGAPSSAKAMVNHLINETLRPEENRIAAYYATGIVEPNQDIPMSRREIENEDHFSDWITNGVRPDLVRLAEYAMSEDAALTVGEIEKELTRGIERAIRAAEGHPEISNVARILHGLPDPEPVPKHLIGVPVAELERRLSNLQDQWAEAVAAADEREEQKYNRDPNAPLAIVRPDLHPLAAIGLGIDATRRLDSGQVEALLAGRRADGELIEGKHYAVARTLPVDPKTGEIRMSSPIGSYDFCTTPDKSISVAWAFASPQEQAKIFQAHVEASRYAIAYMAENVGWARFGNGGKDGAERGHVAWLEFTHHTSRRTMFAIENGEVVARSDSGSPGDPDLHTHHLIPNAVFTESGKVGSLDTAAVAGFIHEADAVYHMRLATHLTELGFKVEFDSKTGAARMSDIPEDIRTLFSKRTAIGELMARKITADRGEDWDTLSKEQRAARLKHATQDLNQKIKGGKDDVANIEDWKRQAKEVYGWEAPDTFTHKVYTVEPSIEMKHRMAYETTMPMLDEIFQEKAVIPHFGLRTAAARAMIDLGGGELEDIDAITRRMKTDGIQQYGEKTPIIWAAEDGKRYNSVTTALHEAHEAEFISLAKEAASDRSGAIPQGLLAKHINNSGLDFSDAHGKAQRDAIERIGTGGRFGVVIGAAGSGKSAMLGPLVASWKEQGRDVYGASLAWRQADELVKAGIRQRDVKAMASLIFSIKNEFLTLNEKSVVALDEFGMLGTKQGLELLRLQKEHGFSIVALGDAKQCESPEAGAIIDLSRRALGTDQIPEIVTTVRQQSKTEKMVAGLFREGRAAEALTIKRDNKTAEMVFGGYDGVVARTATLYKDRLQATGQAPTIAAPTNNDAHRISQAVREVRREMGLVGEDKIKIRATDGERNYVMAIAKGDKVRLFKNTPVNREDRKGGVVGRNGSIVEVIDADENKIVLQSKFGTIAHVPWKNLASEKNGRTELSYGDAMTIHTAQGVTSNEHILALPAGSQAINGKSGYSGNTRHRIQSYILTNDSAEHEAVRKGRAINDARDVTLDDKWANVAKELAYQPEKDSATAMLERVRTAHRGGVREMQNVLGDITAADHTRLEDATGGALERRMLEQAATWVNRATQQLDRNIGREGVGLSR